MRGVLAAVVLEPLWAELSIFEDQCAAISERDFFWPPVRALVVALRLSAGGVFFLVEPVQVRFIVGDPFLDGLPGWPGYGSTEWFLRDERAWGQVF
jgi:hypothetical protein